MAEVVKRQEEHRVLLRNASWGTYERLVAEREERCTPRFFYDRGVLEILSPSAEHDMTSRILAALVELLAEEADIDVENVGSTTFRRRDLARGFEPDESFSDESFYFGGNAGRVRETVAGKGNVELDAGDPAPNLVVEVDVTDPSLNKLPVYAHLGVREVWRYDGGRLTIFGLVDETEEEPRYAEVPESAYVPGMDGEVLTPLVAEGLMLDRRVWRRRVRERAREVG